MNAKERLFLTGLIGVYIGPGLDALAVPKQYQSDAVGYIIIGIPVVYHVLVVSACKFLSVYGPRIRARTLDRWFPPLPPVAPIHAPVTYDATKSVAENVQAALNAPVVAPASPIPTPPEAQR